MVRALVFAGGLALFLAGPAVAEAPAHQGHGLNGATTPAHNVISEDLSDQRRAVFVRLERRLDEADLLRMADAIKARAKRDYARTQINYFLPGAPINQGPWASVLFAPEPKVQVHGLRRDDEDVFVAEHRADRRPLLGSWLTSPPAAPGRLSIYSDHGRIYAEWRLRSGQKTIDELQDGVAKTGRRFDVTGGGYYVLNKAGELEIWDKTTLIATGERIRPEHLALPVAVALGPKSKAPAITVTPSVRTATADMVASPVQPEPKVAASVPAVSSSGALGALPAAATAEANAPSGRPPIAATVPEPVEAKVKPKKQAKAKPRNQAVSAEKADKRQKTLTPGEQIAAKMSGRF